MANPMPAIVPDGPTLRRALVDELEGLGALRSTPVREAFLDVPRELFVPEYAAREGLQAVYRNEIIVTKSDARGFPMSSSSEPQIMAAMLERLELERGMGVLEIGAGSGYNAALLQTLVGPTGRVTSIDLDPDTARRARGRLRAGGFPVEVVCADGSLGHPGGAPYDRIVATGSSAEVPRAWLDQLVEGGLLELPLRLTAVGPQAIATFRKRGSRLESISVVPGQFMPLRGSLHAVTGAPSLPVRQILRADGETVVTHLAGCGLARLSEAGWRRLLSLGEPRTSLLGRRFPSWSLALYLSLEIPQARLLTRWVDLSTGVLGRSGGGLALVEGRWHGGERPTPIRIHAYGRPEAEESLREVLERWLERGRPGRRDLRIEISYRSGRSRIAHEWRRPRRRVALDS